MALRGMQVVELAGLAPGPFCGMLLADFGARVVRIDRANSNLQIDRLDWKKKSLALDTRRPAGREALLRICRRSDVLIEPFRPGVMEKMGLGPDVLTKENPRLVYARLTGYGQNGPMSKTAGHDINYLSIAGVLSQLGKVGHPPQPPVNLLADFGGGGLMCALGVVLALLDRSRTGVGQVVDCSMTEGVAYLSSWLFASRNLPIWLGNAAARGTNLIDGGAPFYGCYECSDGLFVAVGSLEPQFYANLLHGLGLKEEQAPQYGDWAALRSLFEATFKKHPRQYWENVFEDLDACVTPVLDREEAVSYEHNRFRGAFIAADRPMPAPRFSAGQADCADNENAKCRNNVAVGSHTREILSELNYSQDEIDELLASGCATEASLNITNSKL